MIEKIFIKYHSDIEPIVQKDNGDWIDLYVVENVFIYEGEF